MPQNTLTEEPERYRTLKNGAVYDMERKRIVANPGGGSTAITQATATAMAERRRELKRQAIERGASRGASDILGRPVAELEWVELGAEANMHRAADPGNVKGVDAFRSLIAESGLAEPKQQAQQDTVTVRHELAVSPEVLALLRGARDDVVDAEVTSEE